jgi:HlyD family secretion protein
VVSKGDVLYQIDSSSVDTSIKQSELTVSQNKRSYQNSANSLSDLTVTAPISGHVTNLTVAKGDSVTTQTAIATIVDDSTLKLKQYYSYQDADRVYAGMPAVVSVPEQMLNLNGSVESIDWVSKSSDTGIKCFVATISVNNPGSLTSGMSASCSLTASDGSSIYPATNDSTKLINADSAVVYADIQGKVGTVKVKDYEKVTKGQTIVTLTSDTVDNNVANASDTLKNSELSLDSQYQKLDDYTITAPISGTIVNKYYKQGETSESGKALCVIYDLSYLTVTLNVDELDIKEVSVGQEATVTADSASGKTYQGIITKVGINGTTTNGVTTYPVTIRLDETDGLLPGMNADVSITVKESKNALTVPADAVAHGDKILVKTGDGSTGDGAPNGFAYSQIETGVADDNYVEITIGVNEGDTVAYVKASTESTSGSDQIMMGSPASQGGTKNGVATGAAQQSTGRTTP